MEGAILFIPHTHKTIFRSRLVVNENVYKQLVNFKMFVNVSSTEAEDKQCILHQLLIDNSVQNNNNFILNSII